MLGRAMEPRSLRDVARLTQRESLRIAAARGTATSESPDKIAALADTVRALDRIGAPHALVGGVAVGIRSGVPRATLGTDLAISRSGPRLRSRRSSLR
jgi:hypothetical protein